MNRIAPIIGMFLACFGGVFGALWAHEKLQARTGDRGAASLEALVNTKPVRYEPTKAEADFSGAAAKIMPSVVSVDMLRASMWDPSGGQTVSGQGSGVIITGDGYIVTNNHVVENADSLRVHLSSGKQYDARIVGRDPVSDLALLKVEANNLPAAELGDSEGLRIGEWVLAVGNPLGFEGTLSVGIVSALNRDLPGSQQGAPLVGAIQTDAAINQGNSGGALANVHGQVIGINTQIASPNRGSVGIGFAIPASRVRKAVDDIRKYGRVRHPDLGITRFAASWVLQHEQFEVEIGPNPPENGLVVQSIIEGSPAAKAGVERWDVIVEINGKPMTTLNDYLTYLLKAELGQKARVKYWHKGETKEATIELAEVGRN